MTGLLDFALFRQDCNEELIFQFYATLFIFGDMKDMRTRKLQWMTQHTVYEASTQEFLSCFTPLWSILVEDREEQRLHMQDLVTTELLNMLRKPITDIVELTQPLTIADMSFQAKSIYRIMVKTLAPKRGPQRELEGVMHNLLVSIMGCMKFDVEDIFLRTLLHATQEPLSQKPYAPGLMNFQIKKTQRQYHATKVHGSYVPDIEAPTPASATSQTAPAQGTNDRGKSIPSDVGTSSCVPPTSASVPEANANPIAG